MIKYLSILLFVMLLIPISYSSIGINKENSIYEKIEKFELEEFNESVGTYKINVDVSADGFYEQVGIYASKNNGVSWKNIYKFDTIFMNGSQTLTNEGALSLNFGDGNYILRASVNYCGGIYKPNPVKNCGDYSDINITLSRNISSSVDDEEESKFSYIIGEGNKNISASNYNLMSFIFGKNNQNILASQIFGSSNSWNEYSSIIGDRNKNISSSFVFGGWNEDISYLSYVFGGYNEDISYLSYVSGKDNYDVSNRSYVFGENNYGVSYESYVSGKDNEDVSRWSYVFGEENDDVSYWSYVSGKDNEDVSRWSYVFGEENENISYSYISGGHNENILSSYVFGNDNYDISGRSYVFGEDNDDVSGESYVFGEENSILGDDSFVIGKKGKVYGNKSILINSAGDWVSLNQNNSIVLHSGFNESGGIGINENAPKRSLHINNVMRLEPRSTAPTNPQLGDLYVDSDTSELCFYNGSAWNGMTGNNCS